MGEMPDFSSLTSVVPGREVPKDQRRVWRRAVFDKWCKTKDRRGKALSNQFIKIRDAIHYDEHCTREEACAKANSVLDRYVADPTGFPLQMEKYQAIIDRVRFKDDPDIWDRLERTGRNRKATTAEAFEWVSRYLDTNLRRIKVSTVPSSFAVSLLKEARSDRKWFMDLILKRQKASSGTSDGGGNLAADDELLAAIERVKSLSSLPSGTQGSQGKP